MPSLKLSAGVALPQSLPTGTAVGFSVDYTLDGGQVTRDMKCVWVIEPANGSPIERPVAITRASGELRFFAKDVKPEQGPFSCHVAIVRPDGKKEPISAKVDMPSPQ